MKVMRTRLVLITAVGAVACGIISTGADAAPAGFSKTVAFTDATPDPSGNAASGNDHHCHGRLPAEKPIAVKIPGPGNVDVSTAGFVGDWALEVRDASGDVLAGDDANPPATESTSVRLKKAATIFIQPCNLEGSPQAQVTYKYTYKK